MSFGYHRAEILGALASGLSVWAIAGFLFFEAIRRLQSPEAVQGPVVFVIAFLGLIANFVNLRTLHGAKDHNMNVKAAYVHVMSDLMASIGAVVAGLVLWLTRWNPIDPIITILVGALMLVNSWSLIREAIKILMESTPSGLDAEKVSEALRKLEGVREVHDLHIWTVASGRLALSVHLISPEGPVVLTRANHVLQEHYGIVHTTIQVEHPDHFQSERCYDCRH
jgi:cobalt-zinc-cadmium efflux system protein